LNSAAAAEQGACSRLCLSQPRKPPTFEPQINTNININIRPILPLLRTTSSEPFFLERCPRIPHNTFPCLSLALALLPQAPVVLPGSPRILTSPNYACGIINTPAVDFPTPLATLFARPPTMDASNEESESVDQFLARIASLSSKQGLEEAERSRRMEEDMLQARKERQARRAGMLTKEYSGLIGAVIAILILFRTCAISFPL